MLCSIEELVQMGKLGFIQAILEHDKAMFFKKIRGGARFGYVKVLWRIFEIDLSKALVG